MLRMRLLLASAVTALALGPAANAATLSVTTDQPSYQVGDTITLTVTGDAQGAIDFGIFGRLIFDNPSVADFVSGTPSQSYVGTEWFPIEPLTCDASSCLMFYQVSLYTPSTLSGLLIAFVSFPAVAPGVSNANWDTVPPNAFDFFGLTNAAGTTITVVPEPGSAALLGLGLLGVALARAGGRRRR